MKPGGSVSVAALGGVAAVVGSWVSRVRCSGQLSRAQPVEDDGQRALLQVAVPF